MTIIVLVIYFACSEGGVGQVSYNKRLSTGSTLHCAQHLPHPSGQSFIEKMNDLKFNLIGLQSTSEA